MKLQIDTVSKTIKIEQKINLKELFSNLIKLFPHGEWKEYSIEPDVIYNWYNPVIYPASWRWYESEYVYPPYYHGSTGEISTGVFNVEIYNDSL